MTAPTLRQFLIGLLLLLFVSDEEASAQSAAFNQNASRSNHTRAFNQNASRSNHTRLSMYASPLYSTPVGNKNDSLLFRGSGAGIRFGADYFMGKVSIGIASGFTNSSADNSAINNFLNRFPIPQDQLTITKTKQQNMYLLLGPSIVIGNAVQLHAHAKAGLFVNNSGVVSIQQKGAQRAAYRNESTDKNMYPGFLTGLSVQYAIKESPWSIGLGADYMSTKAEVSNFDARRGGGVEGLKLSRSISDVMAGVTIRYTVNTSRDAGSGMASGRRDAASGRPTGRRSSSAYDDDIDADEAAAADRDAASGLSTGRRSHTVKSPRDVASGQATGKRMHSVTSPRDPASGQATGKRISSPRDVASGQATGKRMHSVKSPRDAASGLATGKRSMEEANCGPVTRKYTNPDGSSEEMTFSCPADAAAYKRVHGDPHVDEKDGYKTMSNDSKTKGTIAGTLTWSVSGTSRAIVTNQSTTRGGSTTLNSQSSSTRTTNQSSFGTLVRLSARDAGSGMASGRRDAASGRPTGKRSARDAASGQATGKRSSRDASSGLATGRRQYQPMFIEGGNGPVCNPCAVSMNVNPLYQGNTNSGQNPMHERTAGNGNKVDENCDGIAGADVYLIDINTDQVIAKTKTERCGDFFFANVPQGDYVVRVSAYWLSKKGYDFYAASASDILGQLTDAEDWAELSLESSEQEGMVQKAGISTSRSNIRTKSSLMDVTVTDSDDDGIEVTLSKSPTDAPLQTVWTDDNYEFEFTDIQPGNYFLTFNQEIYIEDETVVSVGENIITSESNLEDRKAAPVKQPIPVKWSAPESYKSILVEADLDGDGVYESNVTNQVSDELSRNEKGEMQQKAGVSTSRSNIRSKSSMQQISNDLYTCTGTAMVNNRDVPIRAVYKAYHDMHKGAIQNLK